MLRKYICILIPVFVLIGMPIFLNNFLDSSINNMLQIKDLSNINAEYGSIYKDRGVVYNEYLTENDYTILQGSSELGAQVTQLPTRFFPVAGMEKFATNGRAYSQHLHQISILGSQNNVQKNHNVALIVSLQWFMDENGIDNNSYQANFSPVQFYNFLENQNIDEVHKKQYARRNISLLSGSAQFTPERLYANLYVNDGIKYDIQKIIFKPYLSMRKYMVALKDKGLLYKKLKNNPEKIENYTLREVDWDEENVKAEQEAESQVSNNDFYIFDTYYDNNIKPHLEGQKDSNKGIDLLKSKEFEDYSLYLDTCVDLGIEPYIILMPTNGRWYDYTGMTKESRDAFYDKAETMARERGFEVLNLKDEEYTPYFMVDVMHLGTKGWLKVDEKLYEHFKK